MKVSNSASSPSCEREGFNLFESLYEEVKSLPVVSPHGHTDPKWFAQNEAFKDATSLFLTPDHYVLRLLYSRGISYDDLGVPRKDKKIVADSKSAWKLFAKNYYLFAGTPSQTWIDYSFKFAFGIDAPLNTENADAIYDHISSKLKSPELLPLAILDKANVEIIATTEFALDPLSYHQIMLDKGLIGRVRTTYRPDDVCDPEHLNGDQNILKFGEITKEDTSKWDGLINAHRVRREVFRKYGATATDHGVPTAMTCDLQPIEKQALLDVVLKGTASSQQAEMFRAQMLTEMAMLSVEDGMVMQIHAGSDRNTDSYLLNERGPNMGADIPRRIDCVNGLRALLNRYGREKNLKIIMFVLDEGAYARELAPMSGYWPSLLIGPPWWFHDSPHGISRYLDQVVETASFYNLAGFNDDTRALLSIPARHHVWRQEVCRFLTKWVAENKISKATASEIAAHLSYQAAKDAYNL